MAIATRAPVKGGYIELVQESGSTITATVNCAPVFDATRNLRGCIVTLDDVTERENLNRQMVGLFAELNESKAQIERQNEELRRLATRDPLTGCLNRRAFSEKLDPLFAAAQGASTALTLFITDIDHFKSFNDRYGHAVGDQVLQVFARSLSSGLRECDLLCRYGGEEFLIVLPGLDAAQAAEVAERLRVEVGERAGKGVRSTPGLAITASFGVASLTADITDPAQIIERADQAMYVAKRSGRNRVTQWAEGMAQQA